MPSLFCLKQAKLFDDKSNDYGTTTIETTGSSHENGFRKAKLQFSNSVRGSTVSFHDINYVVKVKENKQKVDRYILKDVK